MGAALGKRLAEREPRGRPKTLVSGMSILRLQSRFIFGNKRTNLIGHVQEFQIIPDNLSGSAASYYAQRIVHRDDSPLRASRLSRDLRQPL
jgi:hypothetical protein